ncbi:hypothetical protein GDO81_002728 [Engystomops pustulosus]|uniref:Centromere protein K n=1 Tax=Engystomops pustulosus TaxID=76066 RepID=A0AAV7DNK3_ENGPU|nr:hypothetical protein GDO81_002728 [Engystomops pustulosus]
MSSYQHDLPPDLQTSSMQGSEELLQRCEEIWAQIGQCQNQIMVMEPEVLPDTDVQALTAKYGQWKEKSPRDVLLAAGKEELQNVDGELEMMLSTVRSENKKLKSDLEKEQGWLAEQEEVLEALKGKLQELKNQSENISQKSAFQELKNKLKKVKAYREELLSAFGEFLEEHFPLPEEHKNSIKKKKGVSEEPRVQWIRLHVILETLINQLMNTPNDPYILVQDEYWPPYIELLLRYGIALRHPADAKRIRLEAFHQ